MTAPVLTIQAQALVVSSLAHGNPVHAVATKHRIPDELVNDLRLRYGPDLGRLAKASERLHKAAEDAANGYTLTLLVDEATRVAPHTLGKRAERLAREAATLAKDVAAAREREAEAQAEARRKAAEVAQLERQVADTARNLDELKTRLRAAKGSRTYTPAVRRRIRAWARDHGVACPDQGRIPAAVARAYQEAHNAA